jgi:hypothetical protein
MKGINVPEDFGSLLLQAIEYLHKNGRSNIFYHLAKGIGTMRDDGSDSRLPVKRMPFGLVEYVARFFSSDNFQQVGFSSFLVPVFTVLTTQVGKCPEDYRLWQESMYVLFGTKWCHIFNGPMWRVHSTEQGSTTERQSDPMAVCACTII